MSSTFTVDQRNIGEVYQFPPEFTIEPHYLEPLRCSLEWWDFQKLEQKYTFDSWNPKGLGVSNSIPVVEAQVTPPGVSDSGSFYFRIWDTEKQIDPLDIRRKGLVVMKGRKYEQDPDINLVYGFIQKVRSQMQGNQLYYIVSGLGSGVLLTERYVNIRRSARMQGPTSSTPLFNDEQMQIRKLFKEILTNKDLYVVDDIPIAKQILPHMDTTPLDNSIVDDTILAINEPYVQASHALNAMLDSVGADGGIDAYNKPYLLYPQAIPSGILLKSWDTITDQGLESARNTSYFMQPWDWEIDWGKSSGFSNRLLAKSRVTTGSATTSSTGTYGGFVSLFDKDLAQRIPPSPSRFRDLSVVCTRIGAGTEHPDLIKTLHGHIVQDNLGSPTGAIVAKFDIPLDTIPQNSPTPLFLSNLNFQRRPDPSLAHWIILYDRGDSEENTIQWFFNPSPELTGANGARIHIPDVPWVKDPDSSSGWEVTLQNSFNFVYSILDNFTHIIISEDVDSQDRYGIVEDLVDVSFTTNTIAANKYLGELMQIRALPKITFQPNKVTIPNNLFMPGVVVQVVDEASGLGRNQGQIAEVTSATYQFGGGGDTQLGALFCDLSLVGHYDYKVEEGIVPIGVE